MKNRSRVALLVPALVLVALCALFSASASASSFVCLGSYTTTTAKGVGSDCASAQFDLGYSHLGPEAAANCAVVSGYGYCNFVETITTACFLKDNGNYVVKGYATYGCITDTMPPAPSH